MILTSRNKLSDKIVFRFLFSLSFLVLLCALCVAGAGTAAAAAAAVGLITPLTDPEVLCIPVVLALVLLSWFVFVILQWWMRKATLTLTLTLTATATATATVNWLLVVGFWLFLSLDQMKQNA